MERFSEMKLNEMKASSEILYVIRLIHILREKHTTLWINNSGMS